MQQNQKNVEDIPTVELKAAAFDITKQLQFLQGQLSVIEQELVRRAQSQSNEVPQGPIPRISEKAPEHTIPPPPDGYTPTA